MMARTKRSQRSYAAGEWGRNRVRVFPDPKTGLFQIEWRANGRRLSRSLKHREWDRDRGGPAIPVLPLPHHQACGSAPGGSVS